LREYEAPSSTKNETIAASSFRGGDLGVGDVLGPYIVEMIVGRGGSGVVYRARRVEDELPVAIKILNRAHADVPMALSRFQAEVDIVRSLGAPGVTEIYGLGSTQDGRPYVAMEWLEGQTLESLRLAGPMPLGRVVSLMGKLCDVVAQVHAAGIVHRDLKAANVMVVGVGAEERIKLLDFGVAKFFTDKSSLTLQGTRIGTPSYMAPEQITGGRITPQTDIYALGVMLYSMLTGQLPFQAATPVEVEEMHLENRPPRATDVVEVPFAVDDVIRRCLAKKTIQRHGSVADFMEELELAARVRGSASSALRSGRAGAVGVFVAVDPLQKAQAQKTMDVTRRIFADEGIEIALEDDDGTWLLGVLGVSRGGIVSRAARENALAAAIDVLGSSDADVPVRIVVHAALVTTLSVEGAAQIVGGELLSIASWTEGSRPGRIEATRDVTNGLDVELGRDEMTLSERSVVLGLGPRSRRRSP